MTPFELAVDAIAGYRLTRLITTDTITEPVRARIIRRSYGERADEIEHAQPYESWTGRVLADDDPPAIAKLITCPWCTGVWVAAGVTAARAVAPRQWRKVAEVAVVAAAAGLLARGD